jgi:hypothetical protein
MHWETPLSINLDIDNERKEYKTGMVEGVVVGGRRVNERD